MTLHVEHRPIPPQMPPWNESDMSAPSIASRSDSPGIPSMTCSVPSLSTTVAFTPSGSGRVVHNDALEFCENPAQTRCGSAAAGPARAGRAASALLAAFTREERSIDHSR
eukprot:CAMPEP_0173393126 /NCGR_PEP_ID=MMETSP1356-20130122/21933_1 /TAXON_ID=77927 ORGANISM="Hemiselmis virescens, Strain PCC157" /NCGR_SAMPLE_ID=MMETSP1356 /ASSEMBLY_ACC=CAM_ASM_000847 /LENGTH=109 /DNA_ID=CAMNT_0014351099 /DNA_START=50 /DNA_END=379 /DNA_ORIENTATION=+